MGGGGGGGDGVGSVRTLLSPWTWTGLGLNKKELQEKKDVEMNRDTVATVTWGCIDLVLHVTN